MLQQDGDGVDGDDGDGVVDDGDDDPNEVQHDVDDDGDDFPCRFAPILETRWPPRFLYVDLFTELSFRLGTSESKLRGS